MDKCVQCGYWIVRGMKKCDVCGTRKTEFNTPMNSQTTTDSVHRKLERPNSEGAPFTDPRIDRRNPSVTYNTRKLFWWSCPRCLGQDLYVAKSSQELPRPGFMKFDSDDSGDGLAIGSSFSRSIDIDVWHCRKCGEPARKWERPLTEYEIVESKRQGREEIEKIWDQTSTGDKTLNVLFLASIIGCGLVFIILWLFF
jgi:hypothetical protein